MVMAAWRRGHVDLVTGSAGRSRDGGAAVGTSRLVRSQVGAAEGEEGEEQDEYRRQGEGGPVCAGRHLVTGHGRRSKGHLCSPPAVPVVPSPAMVDAVVTEREQYERNQ